MIIDTDKLRNGVINHVRDEVNSAMVDPDPEVKASKLFFAQKVRDHMLDKISLLEQIATTFGGIV